MIVECPGAKLSNLDLVQNFENWILESESDVLRRRCHAKFTQFTLSSGVCILVGRISNSWLQLPKRVTYAQMCASECACR